ncbi:hypothetical protein NEOLEDRAFT_1169488 [Neolentinus lepideus HHB14362 ss-1]|uniref:Uncharacterized protein n=1 Tax=Neolentinus lepideus HHB14362 ss-1 TaxID=1314782 RepID=A0A165SKE5_9AGAM|nr:hypothetical protein NEOLEDRAFT_1169488 [Neolentinus lepideus HHB14362 ss-1]
MSSHNPFRTPNVTPQPTGLSSSSQQRPAHETTPLTYETHNEHEDISPEDLPPLPDEPPPAYSTTADTRHGEASVEFGPRRPFQPPPSTLLHPPSFSANPSMPSTLPYQPPAVPPPGPFPQPTGSSGYPGSLYRQNTGASTSASLGAFAPPPQHPSSRRRVSDPSTPRVSRSSGSSTSAAPPVSDFARDFYAAGAGPAGAVDDSGPSEPRYAPPPGPPLPSSPGKYAPPPGRPPAQSSASTPNSVPDDGRPTRTPVPGHPLLRDGKFLVYPAGYDCHKCHNTGYKNFDPSHPCRKCWEKYAKPYSGAITYTPWQPSPAAASSSVTNKTFQRPLPTFTPPHLSSPSSSSHLRSASSPTSPRPQSYPGPASTPSPTYAPAPSPIYAHAPPPGATIVQPGDPRIGGRLCWACGGRGSISILFFSDTCDMCGGVGRVFN